MGSVSITADSSIHSDEDWVGQFFSDVDTFDIHRLGSWFADDIDMRFGNGAPVVGKAKAVEAFELFWASIAGLSHRRDAAMSDDRCGMQISTVTYRLHNGSTIDVVGATHLRRVGKRQIDRLWVVVDMAPVFAAM